MTSVLPTICVGGVLCTEAKSVQKQGCTDSECRRLCPQRAWAHGVRMKVDSILYSEQSDTDCEVIYSNRYFEV